MQSSEARYTDINVTRQLAPHDMALSHGRHSSGLCSLISIKQNTPVYTGWLVLRNIHRLERRPKGSLGFIRTHSFTIYIPSSLDSQVSKPDLGAIHVHLREKSVVLDTISTEKRAFC